MVQVRRPCGVRDAAERSEVQRRVHFVLLGLWVRMMRSQTAAGTLPAAGIPRTPQRTPLNAHIHLVLPDPRDPLNFFTR